MRESKIEQYLCSEIEKIGGICWKFTSPGLVGVPDRLIGFASHLYLVELKASIQGRFSLQQKERRKELLSKNIEVFNIRSTIEVDEFVLDLVNRAIFP